MKKLLPLFLSLGLLQGCISTGPLKFENDSNFALKVTHNEPRATVFVAHGCDGVIFGSQYYQWANEIHKMGFNAIIIDSFRQRGFKEVCGKGMLVPPSLRAQDYEEAARWVKSQSWHRGGIAVIGFSHGGSTALNIANNSKVRSVDAVIAYYPSCPTQFVGETISNPRIPAQLHLGGKDTWTPPNLCGDTKNYETFMYPNATHAFDVPRPARTYLGYFMQSDPEATQLSKQRVKKFLDENISRNM